MDNDTNSVDWHQFWEHTREMFKRGEVPGGEFYEQLNRQAVSRAITYEEFYHLLGRFPALVVRNIDVEQFPERVEPNVIKSSSGWDILDFGDWVCTSPGRLIWGAYRDGPADDEQAPIIKGNGTLVQQFVDVAYDVMALAVEKGWPAAYVVHGFYGMVRAAWIAAEGLSYHIEGFSPTVNDRVVLTWVNQLLDKRQKEVAQRVKHLRKLVDPSA